MKSARLKFLEWPSQTNLSEHISIQQKLVHGYQQCLLLLIPTKGQLTKYYWGKVYLRYVYFYYCTVYYRKSQVAFALVGFFFKLIKICAVKSFQTGKRQLKEILKSPKVQWHSNPQCIFKLLTINVCMSVTTGWHTDLNLCLNLTSVCKKQTTSHGSTSFLVTVTTDQHSEPNVPSPLTQSSLTGSVDFIFVMCWHTWMFRETAPKIMWFHVTITACCVYQGVRSVHITISMETTWVTPFILQYRLLR